MARLKTAKAPSLRLAVALALCLGAVLFGLEVYVVLAPDHIRCVVTDGRAIEKYGVTGRGEIGKREAVALGRGGTALATRCGLRFANVAAARAKGAEPFLQTPKDDAACGNLEELPACDRLFPPLAGG